MSFQCLATTNVMVPLNTTKNSSKYSNDPTLTKPAIVKAHKAVAPVLVTRGKPRHRPLLVQEANRSDSRSLSPSNNSAFTRVSRGACVSPQISRQSNVATRDQLVSPSDRRRQHQQTTKRENEERASSFNFLAPAWSNFTFDTQKILAAIQS